MPSPPETGTATFVIRRYEVAENSSTRFAVQSTRVLMLVCALPPHVTSMDASKVMALNDRHLFHPNRPQASFPILLGVILLQINIYVP